MSSERYMKVLCRHSLCERAEHQMPPDEIVEQGFEMTINPQLVGVVGNRVQLLVCGHNGCTIAEHSMFRMASNRGRS